MVAAVMECAQLAESLATMSILALDQATSVYPT